MLYLFEWFVVFNNLIRQIIDSSPLTQTPLSTRKLDEIIVPEAAWLYAGQCQRQMHPHNERLDLMYQSRQNQLVFQYTDGRLSD